MPSHVHVTVLYWIFALSGFSGLIYESIWSRYLGLFLGHAAYAQTLVLVIFMGGMASGAWLCSRWSLGWSNLLRGYAAVEGIIGVLALVFHESFTAFLAFFFDSIIPQMASPAGVTMIKWLSATLLILPQSILLGMTFPLMSGGIIRRHPDRPGGTLAMLYFSNSIGGVLGVLASGFLFLQAVGFPGTIRTAGAINIGLALLVWYLAKIPERPFVPASLEQQREPDDRKNDWTLLLVAFLTGAASFIYEIGWIRMLSMVLGSSTHSFELMLSAFILGLALGGLWIRKRIDDIQHPVSFLAIVQICMGIFALATLWVYGEMFSLMQSILLYLPKTDYGYLLYSLSNYGIALLVMLPATFCAGMTLPLITHILLKRNIGERSIGLVYSVNTLGAIAGVVFAVHVGLPFLGLKNLIVSGATIDISLGLLLLIAVRTIREHYPMAITALAIFMIGITFGWVEFDTYRMASGVFRRAQVSLNVAAGDLVVSHFDGKTASVTTVWRGTTITIRTNGKIDAGVNRDASGQPTIDEPTMVLSGALPILLHPNAEKAVNIGLGSGLTSQLLLMSPKLKRLDTIEIERGMVEAAKSIRPRNELVFTDSRSHIHIEDAKTFFSTHGGRYDIIVSEPSNPWISGVAGLFSTEFYDLIARNLTPDGVFLQWLQIYEIDVPLVVTVLKALSPRFVDYRIYAVGSDLLIVARNRAITAPDPRPFRENSKLTGELQRIRIASADDLEMRRIASKKVLEPWLARSGIPANSDYYPRLDTGAERARFSDSNAKAFHFLRQVPLPVLEMVEGLASPEDWADVMPDATSPLIRQTLLARLVYEHLRNDVDIQTGTVDRVVSADARKLINQCRLARNDSERVNALFVLGANVSSHVPAREQGAFWRAVEELSCGRDLSPERSLWVDLFMAVERRDGKVMGTTATELLKKSPTPWQKRYLTIALLLSKLSQRNINQFQTLTDTGNRTIPGGDWDLVVDLLSSHAQRN
jgi:predicted membrane-bound spermidine synthase